MALKELVVLFEANARPALTALDSIDRKLKGTTRRLNATADSMFSFGRKAGFFLTAPILGLGAASISAQAQIEGLEATLTSVLKGFNIGIPITRAVANEMKFLQDISEELGVSLNSIQKPYVKYLAASKDTIDVSRKVVKAFISLGAALKIAPADMNRVIRAIEQMQSKGQVMAEELKLQLGDTVPGAIKLFAKAAGVGTKQFLEMSKQGLISSDILSKVADVINRDFKDAVVLASKSTQGQLNRLSTGFFLFRASVGRASNAVFRVTDKLQFLGKWLKFTASDLDRLDEKGKKILFFTVAFLAGIGPLAIALAAFVKILLFAKAGFILLFAPMKLIFAGLAFLIPQLLLLGRFLLLNPLGLFLSATFLIVKNWERIVNLLTNAKNKIGEFFSGIPDFFVKIITGEIDLFKSEDPKLDLKGGKVESPESLGDFKGLARDFGNSVLNTLRIADNILLGGTTQRGIAGLQAQPTANTQSTVNKNLTINVAPGTTAQDGAVIRSQVLGAIHESILSTFFESSVQE